MSVQELKGGMLELIASVNNQELLERIYTIVQEIIRENVDQTDFWEELTPEQQAELEMAIKESENSENLIPHNVVMDKYQKWLSK